ncbi:ATP-binding cassette domain-containing protein [Acidiferrimicrobium sp. IK]|uniref:ATP-binding cassette domain-containing protein n=1 Tax=Acidiferrimicrobium sp. IK TaxID=2871700 RepID=UPI0021CB0607|nr:ATP-binding cassette domain-containing protein [Acidiferrimicrobium sp. IK]MCU4184468.1 ATP-binding cassette domain-containing protein [Acidiferrimicrobium sp. IK]
MTRRAAANPLAWLGGLLVAYLVIPTVAFVVRLAGSHDRGFGTPGLWGALRVSVTGASIATLAITVLGVPLAYTLARSRGRLAALVGVAVQLPLALPPLMSGILLIYLFGPYAALGRLFHGHLTNSLVGVVLAQSFVAAPFLVVAARSAFAAIDPALDDVAATLGHHPLARFARVSLPVAGSAIAAGMLLTWLRAFGEYGATVLLAYHPYSLPVYTDVQFSGVGLFPTQAPTALALGIAAAAIALSQLRRPRRRSAGPAVPAPIPPALAAPQTVWFDIDVAVGAFRLRAAHRASSHRLAIVGPSGSGKSLTLRTIAGLVDGGSDAVGVGDRPLAGVPTEQRHIGLVPQGLGLFPHRNVWQQLTFAVDADPAVAAWWLDTLHLRALRDRAPEHLSGGQRQRVSLAQALGRQPQVVLLDEPFSALDAPVRDELRQELRRLQLEAGLSTVLVTHDPEEAALLADELVVIDEGEVLQAGTVEEVFARPASPRVARLLGVRNVVRSRAVAGAEKGVAVGSSTLPCDHDAPDGAEILWGVRSEEVDLRPDGRLTATVVDVAVLGATTSVRVRLEDGSELEARCRGRSRLRAGSVCRVDIDPGAVVVWSQPSAVMLPAAG